MTFGSQHDWSSIAKQIVHDTLRVQPGERVAVHADPTYFPELTEQVRIEIARAHAVELCTMEFISPGLGNVRRQMRAREDAEHKSREDKAFADLFKLIDVYIWLPNDWEHNLLQTEDIIRQGWQGRAVHFHWVPAWWPPSSDRSLASTLSAMYEKALFIDYKQLSATQERLMTALRSGRVRVTTPLGTDVSFDLTDAHFHQNNGDASKEFVNSHAREGSARDREEELPAGVIRTVDLSNAEGRIIVPNETYPAWTGKQVGNLTFELKNDHITRVESQYHNDYTQATWALETGKKDRIGEFVVGCNPALKLLPGHSDDGVVPYFGFGAGVVRFSMGNNLESGGTNDTSFFHNWCFLTDATVTANGTVLIDNGKLLIP